jgi:hypothetical protein
MAMPNFCPSTSPNLSTQLARFPQQPFSPHCPFEFTTLPVRLGYGGAFGASSSRPAAKRIPKVPSFVVAPLSPLTQRRIFPSAPGR